MFWVIVHIVDIFFWCFVAVSVGYITFFAICSAISFGNGRRNHCEISNKLNRFLVVFPAYSEDKVILRSAKSFLLQTYKNDKFEVAVVSDHMKPETNSALSELPLTVLQPIFENSSKAKALQYAIKNMPGKYDHVVILDADNIVYPDFLDKLNDVCNNGYTAIQCHRCAKNSDNSIAALDGISEEINNSIFRKGHNNIGLSSALIGSGMCFDYQWFASHVNYLSTAGEDRELEKMLLSERIFIKYVENINVLDEKVNDEKNFQRQRQRWMSAQIYSLFSLMTELPDAIIHFNINYIDKTFQQMLIPRSILLVGIVLLSAFMTLISPLWAVKWWMLLIVTVLSLFIALPCKMRSRSMLGLLTYIPRLTWKMLSNIRHIDRKNSEFIHTSHE